MPKAVVAYSSVKLMLGDSSKIEKRFKMPSQSTQLVKIIVDIAIALEFTDETLINPDMAIEMQESIAGTLQSMDEVDREEIAGAFVSISALYKGEIADYVRSLPDNYGIK